MTLPKDTVFEQGQHVIYDKLSTITVSSGAVGATGGCWPDNYTGLPNLTISNSVWQCNTTSAIGASISIVQPPSTLSLKGDNADIDINGKSMRAWMDQVAQQLNIMTPAPELEKEWDELKQLGDQYRELEKKINEKADVWKKLKTIRPRQD